MFRFKIVINRDAGGKKSFHAVLIGENNKVLSSTEPMKRMSGVQNNISAQLKGMGNTEGIKVYIQEGQGQVKPYVTAFASGTIANF